MASGSIESRTTAKGERRFRARIDIGRSPSTGKRMFKTRTFRTKKAAEKWLRSIGNKLDEGTLIEPSKDPLGPYLAHWIDTRSDLEPATVKRYRGCIENQIIPAVGDVALGQLTGHEIQTLYNSLAHTSYPRIIRTILRQALNQAVAEGLILRNPSIGLSARSAGRQPGDQPVWDAEQLARFLSAASGTRFGALFHVLAATGLRIGEALSLVWRDVDLSQRVLTVGGRAKTRSSRRQVTFDQDTAAILGEHREAQRVRLTVLDMLVSSGTLVFDRGDGERAASAVVEATMQRVIQQTGLPRLTPHGLRHTMSSLLLREGRPIHYVQRRLGHASAVTTLRYYAHVLPADGHAEAETFGEIMRGARESG